MTQSSVSQFAVPVAGLRKVCEPLTVPDDPDLAPGAKAGLGQQRAIDAIRFGLQMKRDGYNLFVLGPLGTHRHGLVEDLAKKQAAEQGAPDDWCYVNNFSNPERPAALCFPPGQGAEFHEDMRALIDEMRLAIPAAFEGDDYRDQLKAIEQEMQKEIEGQWQSLDELGAEEGIGVMRTPTGYVLAPVSDGRIIDDKEFDELPESRRKEIKAVIQRLSEELQTRIEQMPKLRKKHRERVRALDRQVTKHAVSVLLAELKSKYAPMPKVSAYLDAVEQTIIEHAQDFRQTESPALPFLAQDSSKLFAQFEVNLVVGNDPEASAPVVYEPNPSYPNLIGMIEHRSEMGALVTDFRMVRSGALLQANGGYLVLDARRVLERPFVWEALKQALYTKHLRIESPAESYGFVSTTTLKAEPIPLDVKIVLIGERWLYSLLCRHDKEFVGLFKVPADLDDDLRRTSANVEDYAELIADRIREHDLLPFTSAGVQRVVEQQSRRAEDSERVSMHMRSLDDLLLQADHWARGRDAGQVEAEDVVEAVRQHNHRFGRMQTKVIDAIKRDVLLIDTSGACVGQINGLSVADLGEYRFGHPVRITATTRIGTGEVVDIEREVELGGAIHSKGMMILSSALSARYAPEIPLSLRGSVVFEQSYGGVEGDSASVAELCALLSSLSGVPIRQNMAVTGSVNQLGRVQVVGGVNDKIEGFFDVCKERGLDGTQGVIIPTGNVKHLMLREEVVEAVEKSQFNVYAVGHIDEAVTIVTGSEAGQREADGRFPEGSVNRMVEDRLISYAKQRRAFAEHAEGNERE